MLCFTVSWALKKMGVGGSKPKVSFFSHFISWYFKTFSWASKLDDLTHTATADPEGYLSHPVNAYKLVKRLNTEWAELESLVLQDPADSMNETQLLRSL